MNNTKSLNENFVAKNLLPTLEIATNALEAQMNFQAAKMSARKVELNAIAEIAANLLSATHESSDSTKTASEKTSTD